MLGVTSLKPRLHKKHVAVANKLPGQDQKAFTQGRTIHCMNISFYDLDL